MSSYTLRSGSSPSSTDFQKDGRRDKNTNKNPSKTKVKAVFLEDPTENFSRPLKLTVTSVKKSKASQPWQAVLNIAPFSMHKEHHQQEQKRMKNNRRHAHARTAGGPAQDGCMHCAISLIETSCIYAQVKTSCWSHSSFFTSYDKVCALAHICFYSRMRTGRHQNVLEQAKTSPGKALLA